MADPVVVSDRFERRNRDLVRCEIHTPEGVPLVFSIARAGDRAAAVILDLLLQFAFIVALVLILRLAGGDEWLEGFVTLAVFVIRFAYFIYFELVMQGQTPGTRRFRLRVIDARGGSLQAESIFVRNLTRELELFVPISVLSWPDMIYASGPGIVRVFAALWLLTLMLMPILNRQRRRVGDLLAGTIVIIQPTLDLSRELAASTAKHEVIGDFTIAQLSIYGIYELQVLEEALREHGRNPRVLRSIAAKIQTKIAWQGDRASTDPREFLRAFYRAQRERLEHDLVLGKARDRKVGAGGDAGDAGGAAKPR